MHYVGQKTRVAIFVIFNKRLAVDSLSQWYLFYDLFFLWSWINENCPVISHTVDMNIKKVVLFENAPNVLKYYIYIYKILCCPYYGKKLCQQELLRDFFLNQLTNRHLHKSYHVPATILCTLKWSWFLLTVSKPICGSVPVPDQFELEDQKWNFQVQGIDAVLINITS